MAYLRFYALRGYRFKFYCDKYLFYRLKGDWKWRFSVSLLHTVHRNLELFYFQRANRSINAIRVLKTDINPL